MRFVLAIALAPPVAFLAKNDPAAVLVRELKKWESVGVDQVNFLLNASELIPQDQVLESLRLFGREVMPHFTKDA